MISPSADPHAAALPCPCPTTTGRGPRGAGAHGTTGRTAWTRSRTPVGPRCRRSRTGSTPTSSPTAPGGSTTPASSSARRAWSASTPAPPSDAPARTSTRSRPSPTGRCAPWSTPTTTATTPSATTCSPARRSSPTSGPGEVIAFGGPPVDAAVLESRRVGRRRARAAVPHLHRRVTLHVGDLRCEVRHVGTPAHTTNDSIVWIPERSVLFCGDLMFNGGTPFLLMGSIAGAIEVLENVLRAARRGDDRARPRPGLRPGADRRDRWTTCASSRTRRRRRTGRRAHPAGAARETDLGRFADWHRRRADRRQPAPRLRRARRA